MILYTFVLRAEKRYHISKCSCKQLGINPGPLRMDQDFGGGGGGKGVDVISS